MNPKMLDPSEITVSMVVPGFNDEAYIARAIESCTNQTHGNLEIICVDDGSSDNTLQIMEEWAKTDPRIRVVALGENRGTHNARHAGVKEATGHLIMFCDGDDEWDLRAAARAAEEFVRAPYDILHFGSRVNDDGGKVSLASVQATEQRCTPVKGELLGRDLLDAAFRDHRYTFCLARMAYPAINVKRAFDDLGDVWADAGEDAMEYFAVCCLSEIYRGLPECRYYHYHMGDGKSERTNMTAEEFSRSLRLNLHVDAMGEFLKRQGVTEDDDLYGIYLLHRQDQLQELMRNWYYGVRPDAKRETLEAILERWPQEDVLEALADYGTPAMAYACEIFGPDAPFTERQLWLWGKADGREEARREFEESGSYRIGRALTAVPRKLQQGLRKR